MGGKVKRYAGKTDGSSVKSSMSEEDVRSFAGIPENESNAGMAEAYDKPMASSRDMDKAYRDSLTFGNAFKESRAAGDKTFEWQGKTYSTNVAGPKTSKSTSSSSAATTSSPSKMTMEDSMAELNRATGTKAMDPNSDRGPNAVTGNDFTRNVGNTLSALTPIGGGLSKVGVELAMGRKGAETAAKGAQVAEKGREAVTNPMSWMAGPKGMEAAQKVENVASRAAAKAAKAKQRTSGQIPDSVTNGGAVGIKKGGAIKKYAKGGSVSSASSRGDGIAIRGKTKGTMAVMCGGGMYKGKK
jgi:hypothetical protein